MKCCYPSCEVTASYFLRSIMIYLILAYIIPMLFLIYRAKKTRSLFIGRSALLPIINIFVGIHVLGDLYEEWITK